MNDNDLISLDIMADMAGMAGKKGSILPPAALTSLLMFSSVMSRSESWNGGLRHQQEVEVCRLLPKPGCKKIGFRLIF